MFSCQFPFFDFSNDYLVMSAMLQGKRLPCPTHELSRTRGLKDKIWHIIEACWNQDPNKRPTASKVVESIRNLPNLPPDLRPLNDFDKSSEVLSMDDPADHLEQSLNTAQESSLDGGNNAAMT
jgi:hypothetical protein